MPDTEKIIEVENLSVTYRSARVEHRAVIDFSFSMERGETLAIVGESGSGKTTLLRALLDLTPPSAGSVKLFGRAVAKLDSGELAKTRRLCGYVPQDPYGALPPRLTALDAVIEPAQIVKRGEKRASKAEVRERAISLLNELGLESERILNSRAVGLSGGQRQRVELARALMLEPKLLLCDEPTSMQDVSTRGEIITVLGRRVAAGMSMVFVTHDLKLAARAAQRIIVMQNGKLCEEGEAQEVLKNPRHEYTQALIAAIPTLPIEISMN